MANNEVRLAKEDRGREILDVYNSLPEGGRLVFEAEWREIRSLPGASQFPTLNDTEAALVAMGVLQPRNKTEAV